MSFYPAKGPFGWGKIIISEQSFSVCPVFLTTKNEGFQHFLKKTINTYAKYQLVHRVKLLCQVFSWKNNRISCKAWNTRPIVPLQLRENWCFVHQPDSGKQNVWLNSFEFGSIEQWAIWWILVWEDAAVSGSLLTFCAVLSWCSLLRPSKFQHFASTSCRLCFAFMGFKGHFTLWESIGRRREDMAPATATDSWRCSSKTYELILCYWHTRICLRVLERTHGWLRTG